MSNINLTVDTINKLEVTQIIRNEAVRERFIFIYDKLWGEGTGEAAYEREANYFQAQLRDKENLRDCTKFSIFTSFIDLAVCGLSLEPGARALCYLIPRSTKIGEKDGRGLYEKRANLTISGYGELVLRARAGQIRHADNPVLVYEGDTFSFSDIDGRKTVRYTCNLPHTSNHIVAAYLRITRTDGTIDYAAMFEEDWKRLEGYSEENNKYFDKNSKTWVKKANELYNTNDGSIDPGFLCAKLIKHAFKTYPKVRTGKAVLESEEEPQQPEINIDEFYKVDGGVPAGEAQVNTPTNEAPTQAPASVAAGVTGTADNDDETF